MGPRSDERGNVTAIVGVAVAWATLQWGRALMSAEMS